MTVGFLLSWGICLAVYVLLVSYDLGHFIDILSEILAGASASILILNMINSNEIIGAVGFIADVAALIFGAVTILTVPEKNIKKNTMKWSLYVILGLFVVSTIITAYVALS
ncbi:MAG: hypothetical protein Q6373_022460 [Candidatus Sigynarchaeota archaeon]